VLIDASASNWEGVAEEVRILSGRYREGDREDMVGDPHRR